MSIAPLAITDPEDLTTIIWVSDNQQRSKFIDLRVFWALSIALNILLTSLIAGRILYLKGIIRKAVGPYHAKVYTSIAAIIVESAALYTTFSMLYFIWFLAAPNSEISLPVQLVLSIIEVNLNYALSH